MVALSDVLSDLAAESGALDDLVAALPADGWSRPTPAPGWTVAHQIAHLTWTDEVAVLAASGTTAFQAVLAGAAADPAGFADTAAREVRAEAGFDTARTGGTPMTATDGGHGSTGGTPMTATDGGHPGTGDDGAAAARLLDRWRAGRSALAAALTALPAGTSVPWFGTAMSATSMATARIMETWAHGVDIRDALGVPTVPTVRLRHVAYLGFRTMGYAFAVNDRPVPADPVHVRLSGPDSTVWTYGPESAPDTVSGTALDFCLLVTQRRHRDDLALVATGTVAREWLGVAQAFAGPPGAGRKPEPPGVRQRGAS